MWGSGLQERKDEGVIVLVRMCREFALPVSELKTTNVPVNGVVLPSPALLDANAAPLGLCQETALGKGLGEFLGENDVPVLEENEVSKRLSGGENGGWVFWLVFTCTRSGRRHTSHCTRF